MRHRSSFSSWPMSESWHLGFWRSPRAHFTLTRMLVSYYILPEFTQRGATRRRVPVILRASLQAISIQDIQMVFASLTAQFSSNCSAALYERLTHPQPSPAHWNYPFYTPGEEDKRWIGTGLDEEKGNLWVGSLLLCAQLCTQETRTHSGERPILQDLDLVFGPGRNKYCSFGWADLDAIAPWLSKRITKRIDGQGLGL